MSTRKRIKISSTYLKPEDQTVIDKLLSESGISEAAILRGLIRTGIETYKKGKIPTLKLVKLGAY